MLDWNVKTLSELMNDLKANGMDDNAAIINGFIGEMKWNYSDISKQLEALKAHQNSMMTDKQKAHADAGVTPDPIDHQTSQVMTENKNNLYSTS